jgi:hypothetical protein
MARKMRKPGRVSMRSRGSKTVAGTPLHVHAELFTDEFFGVISAFSGPDLDDAAHGILLTNFQPRIKM